MVCHGIPDKRILLDGDILNLDISIYHEGYHADLNETYYVGSRAAADPDSVRLVETTREALDLAIALVKPGTPIRDFGPVIEAHARSRGCQVVATWGGHGINTCVYLAAHCGWLETNLLLANFIHLRGSLTT